MKHIYTNEDFGLTLEEYESIMELVPDETFLVFPYQIMDGAGLKSFVTDKAKNIRDFGRRINNYNVTDGLNKIYYSIPDKFKPSKEILDTGRKYIKRDILPALENYGNKTMGTKRTQDIKRQVDKIQKDISEGKNVSVGALLKRKGNRRSRKH